MSKGMETLLLRAPKGDPCQPAPIRDNVVQIVVFPERTERRVHFEEYLPVCRLGVARLQVVDQGLADPVSQTQSQRRARLPLRDSYCRILPTKVVQFPPSLAPPLRPNCFACGSQLPRKALAKS